MGNTITKSADIRRLPGQQDSVTIDDRFGSTLLANKVKEIMMGQTAMYNGQPLKIHLAKACCSGVIKKEVASTDVISIAFPQWVESEQCKITSTVPNPGKCLSTLNVGFQISEDRVPYCGESDDKPPGLSGKYLKLDERTSGILETDRTTCDNFMADTCAKNLFDQGCIKIGPNGKTGTDGKPVMIPQFANSIDNPMCWTDIAAGGAKFSYGPPECACLNSIFGPNLNIWPSKALSTDPNTMLLRANNPYGLTSSLYFDDSNVNTIYSLNIFKNDPTNLYPRALDGRCQSAATIAATGRGKSYLTAAEKQSKTMTICLNQINIADSNINNANLSDIKQSNNCGQPPSAATTTSSVPTNPAAASATNDAAAAAELKRLADAKEAAAKKAAEDQLKAQEEASRKAAAEAALKATPTSETATPDNKTAETPSSGKSDDNEKADDNEQSDDNKKTDDNEQASTSSAEPSAAGILASLTDQQKMMMIGGAVVLVLLIIMLIVKS